jgi:uroporphyrinogen-III synthase
MRVLVTRPHEDFARTALALEARGHRAVAAPLFAIRGLDASLPSPCDAMLVTSANAFRLADPAGLRAWMSTPVLAVGEQTAAAAREAGFGDVRVADGDGAALADLVRRALPPGARLLHLSGRPRRDEPLQSLRDAYDLHVVETYETVGVNTLPQIALDALRQGNVDAVLHFSPRATQVFADLAAVAGLLVKAQTLRHVVISAAAADPRLPRVTIARHPRLESMIDAL